MRRFAPLITVLLLVAALLPLGPAGAQDPAGDLPLGSIGDSYYTVLGNSGYDVLHYTIDLDVNVAANTIAGTTTIEARALEDLPRFHLDLAGLDVDAITVNDVAAEWAREPHELIIMPAQPLPANETFTVSVTYGGMPQGVQMSAIPFLTGWVSYGSGSFVASEPGGAASWYPVNDHPLDKATYTMEITVPDPYVVAANGVLVETLDENGATTYVWEMDDPMASYLATVNIDEFERYEERGPGGLLIRNYFPPEIAEAAQVEFARTADMIAFFEDAFGPYPFDAYGVVVADTRLGFALETQSLSLFSRNWITGTGGAEEAVAHELAHQWFGNHVSLSDWSDIWLNEGFAVYASWLWFEHDRGGDMLDRIVRRTYTTIAESERQHVAPLSKQDIVAALEALPLDTISYPASTAGDLARILLQDVSTADEIDAFIQSFPDQDITGPQLQLLVASLPFGQVTLDSEALYEFRTLLRLDQYASRGGPLIRASDYLPPGKPPADDLFNRGVYQRGGLTLHALRERVGDDAFFEILRTYYATFAGGNATTADFIAIAEGVSGEELDDLFNAWLYAAELPDIPEMGLSAR